MFFRLFPDFEMQTVCRTPKQKREKRREDTLPVWLPLLTDGIEEGEH